MNDFTVASRRYDLARVLKLRDKMTNDDLTEFCGFAPCGDHFEEFVTAICKALRRVKRQAVWDSVRDLAGVTLTNDDIKDMSWRLAGNLDLLRSGVPVPVWHLQQEKEWVPIQVISYEHATTKYGKPGGSFVLRVLAGTACPCRITKFWTTRFCRHIATKMGYSRSSGDYPLSHISELVSLRLWALIDPECCRPGEPGFTDVGFTSGPNNWNRVIIKQRFRRDWECPYNYDHRCYKCHVGYLECPAATHKETVDAEAEDSGDRDGEVGDDADGSIAESGPGRTHVLA